MILEDTILSNIKKLKSCILSKYVILYNTENC